MLTLKEAREARGIKLQAVADALKVTRQTYAGYEKDASNMSVLQAMAACEFMGYEMSEIFFGTVSSKP